MPHSNQKTEVGRKHPEIHPRARAGCAFTAALTVVALVRCDYGSDTFIYEFSTSDAGNNDQQTELCEFDYQCRDDKWCNGDEICQGVSDKTDEKGCAPAPRPRCKETEECIEEEFVCVPNESEVFDKDGDGHDAREHGGDDCDDQDDNRFPGNIEKCDPDHHDEDCDPNTFGDDFDRDTYQSDACCNFDDDRNLVCGKDCDDTNPYVYWNAPERCDGLDNNCNGEFDHPDEDRDADGQVSISCGGEDCDDEDPNTYKDAPELCDGLDNNCSEGGGPTAGEVDVDGDGYVVDSCEDDETTLQSNDCDDGQPSINPGADELCNGIDDDCDDAIDEDLEDCRDPIAQIDVGDATGCAVRASGTVACWGIDTGGHLGTGATQPHEAARNVIDPRETDLLLSRVRRIALGNRHICAAHFDGRVSCWGDNGDEGRLGFASSENQIFLPQEVVGLDDVVQLSAGGDSTCAVRTEGDVWCWGGNAHGQLGNGTTEDSNVPVQVRDIDSVVSVECAGSYTCAILQSGAVVCWGEMGANLPEIYRDTVEPFGPQPSRLFGLEKIKRISAAASHMCVVDRDGWAGCFGANSHGQLGNGSFSPWEYYPQTVLSSSLDIPLNNVVDIAAGSWIANRIEWVWDETARESVQVTVETASGVGCARVADGQLYCWGSNKQGALGIGDALDVSPEDYKQNRALLPIDTIDIEALEIRATKSYVCIRSASAEVWCWGGSLTGQWTSYGTPQRITGFED